MSQNASKIRHSTSALLSEGGEAGKLMRTVDWWSTVVGSPDHAAGQPQSRGRYSPQITSSGARALSQAPIPPALRFEYGSVIPYLELAAWAS